MTTTAAPYDPTEGLTTKTTKEDLVSRIETSKKVIADMFKRSDPEQQKKDRLAEIEKRLRAKGAIDVDELQKVIVGATEEEWRDAVAFLGEFDDLLPAALQRLHQGGKTLMNEVAS